MGRGQRLKTEPKMFNLKGNAMVEKVANGSEAKLALQLVMAFVGVFIAWTVNSNGTKMDSTYEEGIRMGVMLDHQREAMKTVARQLDHMQTTLNNEAVRTTRVFKRVQSIEENLRGE